MLKILGPKDLGESFDREETPFWSGTPGLANRCQAAAGDQTMDVVVLALVLTPCMRNQGNSDLAANPASILAEGQQRLRCCLEQKVVEATRIALDHRLYGMRQGEDQI